jgi:hypothetical protein
MVRYNSNSNFFVIGFFWFSHIFDKFLPYDSLKFCRMYRIIRATTVIHQSCNFQTTVNIMGSTTSRVNPGTMAAVTSAHVRMP